MKILIAEDTNSARILLVSWLEAWGFIPVAVTNGREAWEVLQQADAPRLVVLDWMMPEMDGLELCAKIKREARQPFTYVILLTSKSSQEDIVTGLDTGADDFIVKPVQPEELRSRINVGVRILNYQRQLLDLDEQKNKLLGMAAHDLRNPLASLQGFSQLLLDGGLPAETEKEFLAIIQQVSQEMLGTLNDLLDISKIESGKFDLHPEALDAMDVIRYRVRLAQVNAERKGQRILLEGPDQLPLVFDRERIGQVLDNLLSNAMKYAPPDTTIQVTAGKVDEQWMEVMVRDQGPGIPEDQQGKLFATFQKVGIRPTGGEKSTGLGLAIVKKIIETHRGRVGVKSRPGEGSRFYFQLPCAVSVATESHEDRR